MLNHWRNRSAASLWVEALVGLALIAGLLVTAQTVAHADYRGVKCSSYAFGIHVQENVCVALNSRDIVGDDDVEAVAYIDPPYAFNNKQWQVDWVHLYKGDQMVRHAESGWMSEGQFVFSTGWFDTCPPDGDGIFHAVVRFRMRWTGDNPHTGEYVKIVGPNKAMSCGW